MYHDVIRVKGTCDAPSFPHMHTHHHRITDLRGGSEIQELLDRLAKALTGGDGKAVSTLWEVPATIVSDEGVMHIDSLDMLEPMFSSAKTHYNERGIAATRGDIQRLTKISDKIILVEIRWPYLDERGREIGAECSDYTLRRDEAGALKIRSVLMRGVERGRH